MTDPWCDATTPWNPHGAATSNPVHHAITANAPEGIGDAACGASVYAPPEHKRHRFRTSGTRSCRACACRVLGLPRTLTKAERQGLHALAAAPDHRLWCARGTSDHQISERVARALADLTPPLAELESFPGYGGARATLTDTGRRTHHRLYEAS